MNPLSNVVISFRVFKRNREHVYSLKMNYVVTTKVLCIWRNLSQSSNASKCVNKTKVDRIFSSLKAERRLRRRRLRGSRRERKGEKRRKKRGKNKKKKRHSSTTDIAND